MENEPRTFSPRTMRSMLILEMASHLVGMEGWPHNQVQVTFKDQGADTWGAALFSSGSPDAIGRVASGDLQLAIINPSTVLSLAVRGRGPFQEPLPLRAITVIGSYDQLAFAVAEGTGLKSLADIREQRFPLRVSLRGQREHSVHLVVHEVLSALGFSVDDITAWGGQVRYDPGIPSGPNRIGAVARGEIDAIFDEAVAVWADTALELGMRFLPVEEGLLQKLEPMGFRRGVISKSLYPGLPADVDTLDFSGFLVYTHAETPDEVVRAFCAALEARKDRIPRDTGEGPLPLALMCRDTREGPLGIPLHPAAEQFWREQGYLD